MPASNASTLGRYYAAACPLATTDGAIFLMGGLNMDYTSVDPDIYEVRDKIGMVQKVPTAQSKAMPRCCSRLAGVLFQNYLIVHGGRATMDGGRTKYFDEATYRFNRG